MSRNFPRLGKRMIRWGTGFDSVTHAEIYDLAAAKPMGRSKGERSLLAHFDSLGYVWGVTTRR